jgi:hypothetical protein
MMKWGGRGEKSIAWINLAGSSTYFVRMSPRTRYGRIRVMGGSSFMADRRAFRLADQVVVGVGLGEVRHQNRALTLMLKRSPPTPTVAAAFPPMGS